jgi:hypothetical protein
MDPLLNTPHFYNDVSGTVESLPPPPPSPTEWKAEEAEAPKKKSSPGGED